MNPERNNCPSGIAMDETAKISFNSNFFSTESYPKSEDETKPRTSSLIDILNELGNDPKSFAEVAGLIKP